VFQREVARIAFGLYASPSYLAECGLPAADHGGAGHRLAAMSEEQVPIADAAWLRSLLPRAAVVARANGREVLANMAVAGIGVACLPRLLGDSFPGLRRVPGVPPIPTRKLWLGVHRDSRALPRVKAFSAFAAEVITSQAEALSPAN
jgi:DNA-binding transcriptional LysR family regulator